MKLSATAFKAWERKAITLLGMSGVGKTCLANMLRRHHWFHYSGDYRIGTRYLDEPILDNIKQQAMQVPFLRELLLSDSIYINNNITVDNLRPLSSFLGKVGNPELGGLGLREFKRRQALHRQAEIQAMRDVPAFISKAGQIYGYRHVVNDAGGSLCELEEAAVFETLAEHTLMIYIQASDEDAQELMRRAEKNPKPVYYPEAFLDEQLAIFMRERQLDYVALIEPDEFVRWVFPRLFYARIPKYEAIARRYGYTVSSSDVAALKNAEDFLALIADAVAAQGH